MIDPIITTYLRSITKSAGGLFTHTVPTVPNRGDSETHQFTDERAKVSYRGLKAQSVSAEMPYGGGHEPLDRSKKLRYKRSNRAAEDSSSVGCNMVTLHKISLKSTERQACVRITCFSSWQECSKNGSSVQQNVQRISDSRFWKKRKCSALSRSTSSNKPSSRTTKHSNLEGFICQTTA